MSTYVAITPARDERTNLERLAAALAAQTARPIVWVIVDDGSTDGTLELARELEAHHSWVRAVSADPASDEASGRGSGRDMLAFKRGLAEAKVRSDFVVKLDADVSFEPDYFAQLLDRFTSEPALGIASGVALERDKDGDWRPRYTVRSHVRGATRVWRRRCLEQVSPLEDRLGWDIVDEARARTYGWTIRSFLDLQFRHHRAVGARDGSRAEWAQQGQTAWYVGYRFSYLVAKALHHARTDPAALELIRGYLAAAGRRDPRLADPEARKWLRDEQRLRRLPLRAREASGRG